MLDIAARLRGAGVSSNMTSVMDAAAHLADAPLREIRDFIDQTVAEIDAVPDRLARDEPITITLELILTIDDEDKERLNLEMDQANKTSKGNHEGPDSSDPLCEQAVTGPRRGWVTN